VSRRVRYRAPGYRTGENKEVGCRVVVVSDGGGITQSAAAGVVPSGMIAVQCLYPELGIVYDDFDRQIGVGSERRTDVPPDSWQIVSPICI